MSAAIIVEAASVASFAQQLAGIRVTRPTVVTARHIGQTWASIELNPDHGGVLRAVFPVDADGFRGDTRKRGQAGGFVSVDAAKAQPDLRTLIERARRMHAGVTS